MMYVPIKESNTGIHCFKMVLFFFLLLSIIFLCLCRYPSGPESVNILEREQIWQYCRAYSFYYQNLPDQSQILNYSTQYFSPNFLLNTLYDTLKIHWKKNITLKIADYDRSYNTLYNRLFSNYVTSLSPKQSQTVFFRKLTPKTAYLRILEFGTNTDDEVASFGAFMDTTDNIILDLRHNGGGYIVTCRNIIEMFLSSNIAYLQVDSMKTTGKDFGKDTSVLWKSLKTGDNWEGKNIAILIDTLTASASEMLTAALRTGSPNTHVIGTKSLGKAIGQILFHLQNDAGLFLTVMRFLPVNGIDYHEQGIIPDTLFTDKFPFELRYAGTRFETNFENLYDTTVFQEILAFDTINIHNNYGCYSILEQPKLPEF